MEVFQESGGEDCSAVIEAESVRGPTGWTSVPQDGSVEWRSPQSETSGAACVATRKNLQELLLPIMAEVAGWWPLMIY